MRSLKNAESEKEGRASSNLNTGNTAKKVLKNSNLKTIWVDTSVTHQGCYSLNGHNFKECFGMLEKRLSKVVQ